MSTRIPATALLSLLSLAAVAQATDYKASYYVDGNVKKEQYRSHNSLENLEPNANVVYACNGVDLILTQFGMNKTSGATLDANFHETGHNSVITANSGAKVLLESCSINSHIEKSDGLTSIGKGTECTLRKGDITMTRQNAAALCAIDGGTITLEDEVRINSIGAKSSVFYTKDGSITATQVLGGTTGVSSPLFRTAGSQTARKCRMTADRANIGSIEAGGNLILEDNEFKANQFCGFLMYSEGQECGASRLELYKNDLTVTDGPLFLVTNTNAEILFRNGNSISVKDKDLLIVKSDEWGVKGSNGGHVTLTSEKQNLKGNIQVDSISSVDMILKDASYNGAINADANPCAKITVTLDKDSRWNVADDSYITAIILEAPLSKALKQITGKYTVYYDASDKANEALGGKEHPISGGGRLAPRN